MQSVFRPRAQRNAFRYRGARQQSRLFAPENPRLRHSPNSPTGFAELFRDDLPGLHYSVSIYLGRSEFGVDSKQLAELL
jgi:hypothetical protein